MSSRWNWKKTAVSKWTYFGDRVPRILDYSTINLNRHQRTPYDHNARSSQTDRRTNIIAIAWRFVLTNALHAKNAKELINRQQPSTTRKQNGTHFLHSQLKRSAPSCVQCRTSRSAAQSAAAAKQQTVSTSATSLIQTGSVHMLHAIYEAAEFASCALQFLNRACTVCKFPTETGSER